MAKLPVLNAIPKAKVPRAQMGKSRLSASAAAQIRAKATRMLPK